MMPCRYVWIRKTIRGDQWTLRQFKLKDLSLRHYKKPRNYIDNEDNEENGVHEKKALKGGDELVYDERFYSRSKCRPTLSRKGKESAKNFASLTPSHLLAVSSTELSLVEKITA